MKSIHILLVEDNEGDILLITDAFNEAKSNNTISIMKDGWEAMKYLEQKDKYANESLPDFILLDINLPKMNGHEVLKNIKSNEKLRHIPVIILTTSSSSNDITQSYQNYANCYITKPTEANDFLKVVTSIEDFWTATVALPKKI
jgi:CheY-like chemotaxis protein